MWRPLRPSVKRQLRRLQCGEESWIVLRFGWEYDEVDRRMRRFAAESADERVVTESEEPLAEVIPISRFRPTHHIEAKRVSMAVGSDIGPEEGLDQPRLRRSVGKRQILVPNALEKLKPPTEVRPSQELDVSHLAELLEFVHWLVHEQAVTDSVELTTCICYQFELGTFADAEIRSVIEVVLSDKKGGSLEPDR